MSHKRKRAQVVEESTFKDSFDLQDPEFDSPPSDDESEDLSWTEHTYSPRRNRTLRVLDTVLSQIQDSLDHGSTANALTILLEQLSESIQKLPLNEGQNKSNQSMSVTGPPEQAKLPFGEKDSKEGQ